MDLSEFVDETLSEILQGVRSAGKSPDGMNANAAASARVGATGNVVNDLFWSIHDRRLRRVGGRRDKGRWQGQTSRVVRRCRGSGVVEPGSRTGETAGSEAQNADPQWTRS